VSCADLAESRGAECRRRRRRRRCHGSNPSPAGADLIDKFRW
jgi:hypothetical protein